MSIDLEMNQPTGSIIQCGVSVGSLINKQILETATFNIYQSEIICPRITKLTGITQKDVDNGELLATVYNKVVDIHNKHKSFINCVSWSGGDVETLRRQLKLDTEDPAWKFGRRWIDVKTVYVSYRLAKEEPIQSGLAKTMSKCGLKFEGRKHNAGCDAENTLRLYFHILDKLKQIEL